MRFIPLLIRPPVYINISSTVRSPSISSIATAAGWSGYEPIICTVNPGVDVSNLTISGIPDGVLTLVNRGRIGAEINSPFGIYTRTLMSIDNQGTIFGIGGKGGQGGSLRIQNPNSPSYYATGNGGEGGRGAGFTNYLPLTLLSRETGYLGSSETLGGSSSGGIGVSTGGRGGDGGELGQAGGTGSAGTASGNYNLIQTFPPSAGTAPGNYIDGNAYVTWISTGTRLGGAI